MLKSSPLYRQVKGLITQSLEKGEWKPGEALPSEFELASRFKVSQGTVRRAIEEIAAENLVIRQQGKGTFVATHDVAHAQFRFLRLVPEEGSPRYPENRFLECKRLRATGKIARQLNLRSGDAVLRIRRILSFDGVPTVFDDICLPANLFKGLTLEHLLAYQGTMYALLETEYGVSMLRAEEKIRAVAADSEAAAVLNVPLGTPLLSVERLAMTFGDQPVEVRQGLYITTHFSYKNELG